MTTGSGRVQQSRHRVAPIELRWQIWLPWLALMCLLLTATRTDPDLWGHVRFGLDFLTARELPSIDPYSFTQGRPWVNHEWASEAAMALVYQLGGSAGLVLMKIVVMGGVVGLLLYRLGGSSPLLAAAISAAALTGALPLSVTVRPQLWSALALTLLVLVLDNRRPSLTRIALSTALFAAWANLHGGWVTGGAALAVHIAMRTIRAPRDAPWWMLLGVCSLAATLLNPYGFNLWRFLTATVRTTRPDISEWQPFTVHEPVIMWISVLAPLLVLSALHLRRQWRPSVEATAVVVLLLVAGLKVSRVAPLVCPAAFALLGPWIRSAWGDRLRLRAPDRNAALVMLAPALLSLVALPRPVVNVLTCLPIHDEWVPDLDAAPALHGARGTLWTAFTWGEYALWHFGPTLKVSIDGRRETVYDDAYIALHHRAEAGDGDAVRQMIARHPDYVWLPRGDGRIQARLSTAGYRFALETPRSFLAVAPGAPALGAVTEPAPACFP